MLSPFLDWKKIKHGKNSHLANFLNQYRHYEQACLTQYHICIAFFDFIIFTEPYEGQKIYSKFNGPGFTLLLFLGLLTRFFLLTLLLEMFQRSKIRTKFKNKADKYLGNIFLQIEIKRNEAIEEICGRFR